MAKKKKIVDVMLKPKSDRRLLSHVPDPDGIRQNLDRRMEDQKDSHKPQYANFAGQRYLTSIPMKVRTPSGKTLQATCHDISQTGALLTFDTFVDLTTEPRGQYTLSFRLREGMLQEGTEGSFSLLSSLVRGVPSKNEWAFQFSEPIYQYLSHSKDSLLFSIASIFIFLCTLVIILLRTESVVYFSSNTAPYFYSIMTATFLLTRYLFGALYKPVAVDRDFTPSITIVIPCYNEVEWIDRTILSCIDQDYPVDKLQLIIVDDGSKDGSIEKIQQIVRRLCNENPRFKTKERIRVFFQKVNQGKREAMALGIRNCNTDLIAFVDSDSFLEPDAIRQLIQPFYDPKVGGVTGRTDVVNTYTNNVTKMQAVRYYISFRIFKAAEAYFDSVMCLSGPLSAYRLDVVNEVLDKWVNQTFLGQKATFGDDRSLTNFVVRNHRTYYQDTAICSTLVPNTHKVFLKQQMRWKRSWLRESLKAGSFMWKKEPLMAFSFYIGLLIPLIAPLIVLYNLVYIPLFLHIFPTTFLIGLLMMAFMMSFAQLLLKKSGLWIYGLYFCLYYEAILLWQMPWAWFTFWVSSWGTRGEAKTSKKPLRRKEGYHDTL